MGSYKQVRRMIFYLFLSFPFLLLYGRMQPGRSAPTERDGIVVVADVLVVSVGNNRHVKFR